MIDQVCATQPGGLGLALSRAGADAARRAQVKVCVSEFNKVDKTSRVKRALRASEFKDRFEAFNAKLKCVRRRVLRRLASLAELTRRRVPYCPTTATLAATW